jgi:RNA polymerase sigma-70 factor (ECF subfamily)
VTDANKTETLWIAQARMGNTHAFGELVRTYQDFVYHLALRTLCDAEEAQDATQEVFLRAWRGLPGFRGDSKFSTWLYQITVHLCYNRRPRLRRDLATVSLEGALDVGLDVAAAGKLPPHVIEDRQQRTLLQQQVDALPPEYRLLISLRYQQELSYEEIAQVTQMPLGTVKTGLFRAKALLKKALCADPAEMEVQSSHG